MVRKVFGNLHLLHVLGRWRGQLGRDKFSRRRFEGGFGVLFLFTDPESEAGQANTFTGVIFVDVLIVDLNVFVSAEVIVFVFVDLFDFVGFEFGKEMDGFLFGVVEVVVGFGGLDAGVPLFFGVEGFVHFFVQLNFFYVLVSFLKLHAQVIRHQRPHFRPQIPHLVPQRGLLPLQHRHRLGLSQHIPFSTLYLLTLYL